ncbi:hypothetical protein HPB52_019152 [Rhipicephalus sanguineus]|uniref:Paired domain-containing protein n=1 Tax=Rhipicephalus sanguineus TaxID=34632 RepID=A0A9D4TBH2_RHISA|nr:hypothetical protein HPB52_019152 [Rhipicephalus sanguineus]
MSPRVPADERRRIVELSIQGFSQRVICRLLQRSRNAVSRAIQAYRQIWGISDRDRAGRSRCTDDEVDRLIIAAVVADPHISAKGIKDALHLNASVWTIRRRLAEAGLANCVAAQKPHITDRQRSMRLQFARSVQTWGSEEWGEVVFSDESTFSSRWDQERRVWRPMNSRYSPQYTQSVFASGRCSVSVWTAMTREGLGPLVLIDGNLSASTYSLIIERELLPYVLNGPFKDGCFVYQHDRSPIHTARSVKSLLEGLAVRTLEGPPVGADLNPIENVWGLVKRRLAAQESWKFNEGDPIRGHTGGVGSTSCTPRDRGRALQFDAISCGASDCRRWALD